MLTYGNINDTAKDREIILGKAMQKAIDKGWSPPYNTKALSVEKFVGRYVIDDILFDPFDDYYPLSMIVFDPTFAKALWGKERTSHLQQMVIADDPIKYLGENI